MDFHADEMPHTGHAEVRNYPLLCRIPKASLLPSGTMTTQNSENVLIPFPVTTTLHDYPNKSRIP